VNAPPRVGPVVISEIMYHPLETIIGEDTAPYEFIELQNITGTNVPLYCTFTSEPGYGAWAATNTWRLRNAVDFDFPVNSTLPAADRLLVVGFDPATNAAQVSAFFAHYGTTSNTPILGPWSGLLNNGGETIELKAPDKPDVTPTNIIVPYVTQERIAYDATLPWPAEPDDAGASLQRIQLASYGNDPLNWEAAAPNPGNLRLHAPTVWIDPARPGVCVQSEPGFVYWLEYKTELSDPAWTTIAPGATGTGEVLSLPDSTPSTGRRFYRVRAQ